MLKRLWLMFFCTFFIIGTISANETEITVEIRGVIVNGGIVYGAIYSSENSYKNKEPQFIFHGNSINENLNFNLQIPAGEYVISVYQDTNNNISLDTGLFGIPKEPIGITNYNGRGIPGNFNRLKVSVGNGSRIIIQMYRL